MTAPSQAVERFEWDADYARYFSSLDGAGTGLAPVVLAHDHDAAVSALTARVRELEAAREWRPIESAPVGEVVLLCDVRGNRWTDCSAFLPDNGCGLPAAWWMPLPEPPKATP